MNVIIGILVFIVVGVLALLCLFLKTALPPSRSERVFTEEELKNLRLHPRSSFMFYEGGYLVNFADLNDLIQEANSSPHNPIRYPLQYMNSDWKKFSKNDTDDFTENPFIFTYREETTNIIYFVKMRKKGKGNYYGIGYAEFPEIGKIVLEDYSSWENLCYQAISLLVEKTHKFLSERGHKQPPSDIPTPDMEQLKKLIHDTNSKI